MEKPIVEEKLIIELIVERSPEFDNDFKCEQRGKDSRALEKNLWAIVHMLATGQRLSPGSSDHALIGDRKGYRECHIKHDLLLIYQKTDDNRLVLVRLGSHARLF